MVPFLILTMSVLAIFRSLDEKWNTPTRDIKEDVYERSRTPTNHITEKFEKLVQKILGVQKNTLEIQKINQKV